MPSANYYDSALFVYQGRVRKGLTEAEVREKDTMVLQYALNNSQFFENVVNINEIKQSVQRPVYGYQFNRITTANGSGMTTFPSGGMGSSVQIPMSFVTFTQNFSTTNVTGLDNVFQFGEIFDNQARQAMRQIRTGLREWLTNNLYINRTTVLPYGTSSIKNATFDSATATYLVSGSNPYSKMTSVMRQASYGASSYDALFDPVLYPQFEFTQAQGVYNATNLNYQFAKTPTMPAPGGFFDNIWEDLNLANDVGYEQGYALVMPKNSFSFVQWMPNVYYRPDTKKSFDEYVGGYGTIGDDMYDGLEYQIFGWNNQTDTTGSYGYAQAQTQNWQIGITVAFITAYLSNSGEYPIYGFAIET